MLLYLWEMDFITTQCMCFCLNIFIFIVKHLKTFLIWLSISSFSLNHSSSLSLSVQIIRRHFHWRDKGLTTYVFWPFLNLANWCSKWIMFSIIPCNRVYIIKWIKVWQVCQSRFRKPVNPFYTAFFIPAASHFFIQTFLPFSCVIWLYISLNQFASKGFS